MQVVVNYENCNYEFLSKSNGYPPGISITCAIRIMRKSWEPTENKVIIKKNI